MQQPEKWKETIDPFKINFKSFKLQKILGYPHARNDVFYCAGKQNNKEIKCFIKYGSKPDSNIIHEANGLAVIAHPWTLNLEIDELEKFLKHYNFDGIEVYNHNIITRIYFTMYVKNYKQPQYLDNIRHM